MSPYKSEVFPSSPEAGARLPPFHRGSQWVPLSGYFKGAHHLGGFACNDLERLQPLVFLCKVAISKFVPPMSYRLVVPLIYLSRERSPTSSVPRRDSVQ